jgi:glyoxylase-like metal-dependent hydrolase (beta-lactamase superfamily II)
MLASAHIHCAAAQEFPLDGFRVHRIDAGSNVYVVEAESTLALVDAGYPGEEKKILKKIETLSPKRLRMIFLTHAHFDHYGSAEAVRRATGAKIGIHALDSGALSRGETPIKHTRNGGFFGKLALRLFRWRWKYGGITADRVFEDGDSIGIDGLSARVIHTPGHTRGSSCLLVEDSVLFCGDLISAQIFGGKQRWYADNWDDIDRSMEKIMTMGPKVIFSGHGKHPADRAYLLSVCGTYRTAVCGCAIRSAVSGCRKTPVRAPKI